MGAHHLRAMLLFGQSRYDLAEEELRQELAEDPQNADAHALLALVLAARERFEPATEEARQAIVLGPDNPYAHFAMGRVMLERNRLEEASRASEEAVRLDPENADLFALLARVRFGERRWPAALEAAERGLERDAEHVACNNLRAMALIKMGRRAEAGQTLDAALARDPEDASTHANRGWTLLERGDPKKSLEHFREALRLEPGMEWARAGIVEALKARNFVYRAMLRYFLWMTKLSGKAQWGVVIGAYFVYRILGAVAESRPRAAPFINPLLWAYVLFALMTWLAHPLFDLMLRLNRFGRLALSKEQVSASNAVGLCLFPALAFSALWFATDDILFVLAGGFFGIMMLPVAGTFKCPQGWPRRVMTLYTAGMAALGLFYFSLGFLPLDARESIARTVFGVFLLAAFLSQFVVNGLIMARVRR